MKESLQDKMSNLEVKKFYKITYNPDLFTSSSETETTYGRYYSSDDSNYNFGNITISKIGLHVTKNEESTIYSKYVPDGLGRTISIPLKVGSLKDIQQISSIEFLEKTSIVFPQKITL